jgi:serine/threonine protein kinase
MLVADERTASTTKDQPNHHAGALDGRTFPMKCPHCGNDIDPAARFCGACGKKLTPQAGAGGPSVATLRPGGAPQQAGPQRMVIAPSAAPRGAEKSNHVEPQAKLAPIPAATPNVRPPAVAVGSGPAAHPGLASRPPGVQSPVAQSPMPISPSSMGPGPMAKMGPGAGATPGKDPFVGQTLNNRYLIETKLGQGGFGAVYKGKQTMTGRAVAIKVLHPEMARDNNLLQRFKREGTVACNLRDAHTVTTYDFDQTPDGVLYIAMELLSGKSLHDIFYDEAPLAWRRVLRVLEQMCSSLGEAHRQGIVHRDIKPENIYLEERPGNPDYVKVLDFGIAKIIRGDIGGGTQNAPQLTATGQTLGTLEYMSPEQLMGKQLDGRSDIYAMGVLAFELLTGHLPFPDAQGPAELIGAQLKKTPPAPSVANPSGDIPPSVDAIILKMLEKDRARRYQDVDELLADIAPVLSSNGRATGPAQHVSQPSLPLGVPVASQPAAPAAQSPVLQTNPGSVPPQPRPYVIQHTTSESTHGHHEEGPNRVLMWALAGLLVIAAALAGVYFGVIRRGQETQAAPPPAAERR